MGKVTFYKFEGPLFKGRPQCLSWAGVNEAGEIYISARYLSDQDLLALTFEGCLTAWLDEMAFIRITDILTVIDPSRHGMFLKAERNIKQSLGLLPGSGNQAPLPENVGNGADLGQLEAKK